MYKTKIVLEIDEEIEEITCVLPRGSEVEAISLPQKTIITLFIDNGGSQITPKMKMKRKRKNRNKQIATLH